MISILATIDGSSESRAVIPMIEKLASDLSARIQLLTVVVRPEGTQRRSSIARAPTGSVGGVPGAPGSVNPPTSRRPAEPNWAESEEQAFERAEAEGKDYLESAAQTLRDRGLQVETDVIVNRNVSEAIIDFARTRGSDLIAMATHGRSGLNELVQGSVSSAVVRSGVAPVLLVRPTKT